MKEEKIHYTNYYLRNRPLCNSNSKRCTMDILQVTCKKCKTLAVETRILCKPSSDRKWATISDRGIFIYIGNWDTAFEKYQNLERGMLVEIIGEK